MKFKMMPSPLRPCQHPFWSKSNDNRCVITRNKRQHPITQTHFSFKSPKCSSKIFFWLLLCSKTTIWIWTTVPITADSLWWQWFKAPISFVKLLPGCQRHLAKRLPRIKSRFGRETPPSVRPPRAPSARPSPRRSGGSSRKPARTFPIWV